MEKKRTDDARPDYLQRSKQALKDQAAEVVSAASRIAGQAQEAAAAKGAEIWDDAREKVREWNEEVGSRLGETASGSDQLDKPFWKTSVPNSMICEIKWRMSRPRPPTSFATRTPATICCSASPASR
jgi:ElaB/YqjD/DUF883 family membrane-anchored ribosome-binding protein